MWDILFITTDPDKTTTIALFFLDHRIDYRHRNQTNRDDYKVELMAVLSSDQLIDLISLVTDFPDQNHYYLSVQICN